MLASRHIRSSIGLLCSRGVHRPFYASCTTFYSAGLVPALCRRYAVAAAFQEKDFDLPPSAQAPPPNKSTEQLSARRSMIKAAQPFSSFLTDTFHRQHDYLRISITEKCNLRCLYCMPEEGIPLSPKKEMLTVPEILYLSSLFVSRGVSKIRLTGGEPTIHPQILPLLRDIGSLRSRGLRELALTTNGLTLARKLDSMVDSGVTGINLSLDTLDPFQFEIMTRRRGFEQVMKSITRILEMNKVGARLKLKINAVMIRGLNDHQILPFVEMTQEQDLEVRFIEYMPFSGNKWSSKKMLGYQEMLTVIRERHPHVQKVQDHPNDTSKTFKISGFQGRIGFITSMTDHFCGSCNRLRITSDGNLKVCLFGNAEVSLRDMMRASFNHGEPIDEAAWEAIKQVEMDRRQGKTTGDLGLQQKETELLDVIGMAVKRKKEKHAGIGQLEHMKNRPMILIGDVLQACSPGTLPQRPLVSWSRHYCSATLSPRLQHHHQRAYHSTTSGLATQIDSQQDAQTTVPRTAKGAHLTHLSPSGSAHMVSMPPPVAPSTPANPPSEETAATPTHKPPTTRRATARAVVRFSNPTPARLIRSSALKKGDVLSVARIAGIMAAKRTSELIPLCHNIALGGASVRVTVMGGGEDDISGIDAADAIGDAMAVLEHEDIGPHGAVVISASVHTHGQTGVEMEALTAASVAGLTVYDMCKAVDRGMRMDAVRVVMKEGGASGDWEEGKLVKQAATSL